MTEERSLNEIKATLRRPLPELRQRYPQPRLTQPRRRHQTSNVAQVC